MFQSFSHIILYFILYGTIGWFCETLYCSIPKRRFVRRGFLWGPCCPVYGLGAFLILWVSQPVARYPLLVFAASVLAATLLEYVTGWLLEKLFQIRWWDYTDKKFQLNGRIRLKNSLLFGFLGLVVTYLVNPWLTTLMEGIPANRLRILANTVLAVFLLDLIVTIGRLTGFTQKLQQLQSDLQELHSYNGRYHWFDSSDLEGSLQRLKNLDLPDLESNAWIIRLESVLEKKKAAPLPQLSTYGSAGSRNLSEAWEAVQSELRKRKEREKPHALGWGVRKLGAKTASTGHTAVRAIRESLRYDQLFWVFLLAGVLGYLVETVYCLVTTGGIESRQGLLYGPFNQVYGFGAVLMVLILAPLARRNDRWVFVGGAVLGGAFEVLCSWIQELVFGSVSWQYSDHPFSIAGGRTSLLFMFFWGILGLWLIKGVYPRLLAFMERIPRPHGRALTAILSVLLACNLLLSTAAVTRWAGRVRGEAPQNAVAQYLDQRFPDEFMENVYPNMLWPDEA